MIYKTLLNIYRIYFYQNILVFLKYFHTLKLAVWKIVHSLMNLNTKVFCLPL